MIEIKPSLKYEDENGTQVFFTGDSIICYIKKGFYAGEILGMGMYKENEDSEEVMMICLDTFDTQRMIKVDDITYICKVPLADIKPLLSVNEKDKRMFVKSFTEVGYDSKEVEGLYDAIKEITNLYNIPISQTMALAMYNLSRQCVLENVSKEASSENECVKNIIEIKDVTKECYTLLIKWYQAITNVLVDAIDSKMGNEADCKD